MRVARIIFGVCLLLFMAFIWFDTESFRIYAKSAVQVTQVYSEGSFHMLAIIAFIAVLSLFREKW